VSAFDPRTNQNQKKGQIKMSLVVFYHGQILVARPEDFAPFTEQQRVALNIAKAYAKHEGRKNV
jgi:hypothetical protein